MSRSVLRHLAVGLVLAVAWSGCRADDDSPSVDGDGAVAGTVSILAASSLTDAMGELTVAFERAHPGVDVDVSLAGSSLLAAQILEGVPADLFVAADESTMGRVVDAGLTDGPTRAIATNTLQLVVASGNPRGVQRIEDLVDGLTLALCRSEVPCGSYADRAFEAAGLEPPRAGRLDNVKAVLARVQLGEADAGVVYRSDILGADGVVGVELGGAEPITATYPASVLAHATNPAAARAFLRFLSGAAAQAILRTAGFGSP